MGSRTPAICALLGCCFLLGAATTFLTVPSNLQAPPSRSLQQLNAAESGTPTTGGFTGAAVVAAAGLVAAAAAMVRRQSKISVAAVGDTWDPMDTIDMEDSAADGSNYKYSKGFAYMKDPIPPYGQWAVEYVRPEPTSEKEFALMVGADVELNDAEPWDPMGFAKLFDRNFDFNMVMTYPHVQFLREAEIKHGRVCMLAFVGMVVQQWVQIPNYPHQPDWEKALWECYADPNAKLGLVQISIFAFVMEGRYFPLHAWIGKMDREPGDLGFDPLKFSKKPGFDIRQKQLVELKNGRLAMVGVASIFANHAIPGSVPLLNGAF